MIEHEMIPSTICKCSWVLSPVAAFAGAKVSNSICTTLKATSAHKISINIETSRRAPCISVELP